MYKLYIAINIIVLAGMISCNRDKTSNYKELEVYEKAEIAQVPIENGNYIWNLISKPEYYLHPQSKDYIYILDIENNKLLKYKFGSNNLDIIFNIPFNDYILSFFVDERSQYISFIIDDINTKLLVYDFTGKNILNKNIPQLNNYGITNLFRHILIDTTDFYASHIHENYLNQSIQFYWNLKEDYVEALPIYYPHNYKNHYTGISYNIERVLVNDSVHAFSFQFNDSIFLYNINTKKVTAHLANSKLDYRKKLPKLEEVSLYHNELTYDLLNNYPLYYGLKYLPLRGLYIRSFRLKSQHLFTVFYDKHFNYIGEIEHKKNFFLPFDDSLHFNSLSTSDTELISYYIKIKESNKSNISIDTTQSYDKYLKDNFDAGVQKFLEKTKLIPAKNDSIIIYQSTHCAACVQSAALNFLKEKDNKNTTIIVFDESDKEMRSNHIFLSPIVLCEDNSLTEEGYYHSLPHLYFWKGNKVTSSPIVKEET